MLIFLLWIVFILGLVYAVRNANKAKKSAIIDYWNLHRKYERNKDELERVKKRLAEVETELGRYTSRPPKE